MRSKPLPTTASNYKKATVVSSAAGFEQNIADAPASISVISSEELGKKSYANVLDAVKNIPGVYMTGGGSMGDISIRGMSAGYTLMLVDGRPISAGRSVNTNGTDGGKQIGLPPLSMIERIEVIRGPMSSLYGSDAMGGVVNIITKKATAEWSGNINTEYTKSYNDVSNDEQKVDFVAGGAIVEDLLGLQVSGSWYGTDESDFATFDNKASASKPDGENKEAGIKLSLTPNQENDISLSYNSATRDYKHNVGKSLTELDKQGKQNKDTSTRYEKDIYALTHDGRYDTWLVNSYLQHDVSENVSNMADNEKKETHTTINSQATTFINNHTLTFGGQYKKEEVINATNGLIGVINGAPKKMDRWLASLYAEMEWSLTSDLSVTTGLRYNDDEYFGSHWSPRIYSVYHLTDDFTLKGGISTGYKQPSLTQSTEGFGGVTGGPGSINKDSSGKPISRALMFGNPNLKPEESTSYEFGFVYDDQEAGINTSVMLFHTVFDNKIAESRSCDSGLPDRSNDIAKYKCEFAGNEYLYLSTYENIDKAQMSGVEATFDYNLTQSFRLSPGYTYTKSKQKSGDFKGQPLNKTPKHMLNLGLDLQATDKLNLWSQFNYRGKTSNYLSRTEMKEATPGYGFLDAGLAYKLNPRATAKFGVYNIANKNVSGEDYEAVLDGRRVNLGLSVDF